MLAGLLCLVAGTGTASARPAAPIRLHVPSPDWRDQIVYFLVTDRFDDGDPANNDQGAGEFDPSQMEKYSGGDLRGVTRRLDYIRRLGATAVWITPPVANQWWDPRHASTGYHGYWAEDFMALDRHLGTLEDYRHLSRQLHARRMYLVQDIVLNHTGNFFAYGDEWDPGDPARHFRLYAAPGQLIAPAQPPFDMNDARNPEHRKAGIYHWTPDIKDYTDRAQVLDFQMSGLDDLNTENPLVRRALRRSYGYWIRQAGVDAFRLDTAFYVPTDFLVDFMTSRERRDPGIKSVARQTGRERFMVFGEGFAIDPAYSDTQSRKVEGYMNGPDGRSVLPGMLNFPLYGTIGDTFARGHPTAELGDRIRRMTALHKRLHLMPTFVDNHDVDRFLAGGSLAGLRQSLLLIMTLPGIPTLYYGTEQGFTQQRAAMFKSGFQSGGRDHFDTSAPLYRFIQRATALRRQHRLFSRGLPTILAENPAAPGTLAYRMERGREAAIVAFNSADHATLLDKVATGLPPGTLLRGLFSISGAPADVVVGPAGRISLRLPPRSGLVWKVTQRRIALPKSQGRLTLAVPAETKYGGDFRVSGSASGLRSFKLVVDGDVDAAQTVRPDAHGRWQAEVDTGTMADPSLRHSLVAWAETPEGAVPLVSETLGFTVDRPWKLLADVADAAADDVGPAGNYLYPTDPSYGANRQMDIRRLRAWGVGGALKVDLTMNRVTRGWNPQNGFDHVAFTLFIHVPGRGDGTALMPLQNGRVPHTMTWHYRLRVHGWSNALFSADGANAAHEGTPVAPAADIRVDQESNTISFILPAAALGGLKSLAGVKLYLNTWDYDGGYRRLTPEAQGYSIGGGDGNADPLVMDDTPVVELP